MDEGLEKDLEEANGDVGGNCKDTGKGNGYLTSLAVTHFH